MQSPKFAVLIVDDDEAIRIAIADALAKDLIHAVMAESTHQANEKLDAFRYPLIIVEARLHAEWIRSNSNRSFDQRSMILLTTELERLDLTRHAMYQHVFDWVCKPLDLPLLRMRVRRAREHHELLSENQRLRQGLARLDVAANPTSASAQAQPETFWQSEKGLAKALQGCERMVIERALESCGNHREKTAQMLGISVRSLHYKMVRYGLR